MDGIDLVPGVLVVRRLAGMLWTSPRDPCTAPRPFPGGTVFVVVSCGCAGDWAFVCGAGCCGWVDVRWVDPVAW